MILITMPCVVTSQFTNLEIKPEQVKNIYIGLKQGEINKQKLNDCISTAKQLNELIQVQNDSLQLSLVEISKLNELLSKKQNELLDNAVKIEKLEKIPWYKRNVLYLALGFIGGIYLIK